MLAFIFNECAPRNSDIRECLSGWSQSAANSEYEYSFIFMCEFLMCVCAQSMMQQRESFKRFIRLNVISVDKRAESKKKYTIINSNACPLIIFL